MSFPNPTIYNPSIEYQVAVPINLAKSLEGNILLAMQTTYPLVIIQALGLDSLTPNSNINLHVTVWTVSDVSESPFRAQIWFNTTPPGSPYESTLVTPANLALSTSKSKIKLQYSSNVTGEPIGGIKAFVRRGQPETTIVDDEQGKFIFPPGGSF